MHIKPDAPCRSCPLWGGGTGYVPADGTGESGVLVVAEAAGESEAESGTPLCGKAGHYLFSNLARAGVERTGLRLHNVLSCRPPNNKLVGMSYERAAIEQCSILLDLTIEDMKDRCKRSNKTFTIVTLGKVAFKRIMNLDEKRDARLLKSDYFGYPFWSERYSAYVIAGAHPSYLMRGNHHELPVLQYVFQRALEIASNGLQRDKLEYLLDPDAAVFRGWVQDFKVAYDRNPSLVLSVDIETPMKQDMNEEEVAKEGDDDYTILRCSFAYAKRVVSVPWRDSYLPFIEELMAHPCAKLGWNFQNYDAPRIMAQMPIHGDILDGMLA